MSTTARIDRGVEHPPAAVAPRLDVAAPLAPEQEEEEGDREEERDPQQAADGRDHLLEREDDDHGRDEPDDQEAPHHRVHVREEALDPVHQPVMNARTASAAASAEVPANHASRFAPTAGA